MTITRRETIALLAAMPFAGAAAPPAGRLFEHRFATPTLGAVTVTVWTPPGHESTRTRRPVLYMHDGQNLFDPAVSGYGKVWHVDRAVEASRLGAGAPIVVGIWNAGAARFRTYLPAPIARRLPAAVTAGLAARIGGDVRSDAYLDFLTGMLKPAIDARYRTRPGRADTMVMGSSMGGLISLYAMLRHPGVFGAAGCLSTHWPLFIPEDGSDAPFRAAVIAGWTGWLSNALGAPAGRRIWFDHGTATLDSLYRPYQAAVDALLPRLGWRQGRDFVSRTYPGAAHEEGAWAARVRDPIDWLLRQPSRR